MAMVATVETLFRMGRWLLRTVTAATVETLSLTARWLLRTVTAATAETFVSRSFSETGHSGLMAVHSEVGVWP
jgi:hypothetical protein